MKKLLQITAWCCLLVSISCTPTQARSLWESRGEHFKDYKAFRINDIVTVVIDENSTASNKAGTKLAKNSSLGVNAAAGTGLWSTFLGFGANGTASDSFKGEGETTRSGQLQGKISVRVTNVLPNGHLLVEGERLIVINEETQRMSINGIIRPRDVQSDNTIPSTLVANAQIKYIGSGTVAEKQKPGLMTRLLGWLWIF